MSDLQPYFARPKAEISLPTEGNPAATSRSLERPKLKASYISEDRMQDWLKTTLLELIQGARGPPSPLLQPVKIGN